MIMGKRRAGWESSKENETLLEHQPPEVENLHSETSN